MELQTLLDDETISEERQGESDRSMLPVITGGIAAFIVLFWAAGLTGLLVIFFGFMLGAVVGFGVEEFRRVRRLRAA